MTDRTRVAPDLIAHAAQAFTRKIAQSGDRDLNGTPIAPGRAGWRDAAPTAAALAAARTPRA